MSFGGDRIEYVCTRDLIKNMSMQDRIMVVVFSLTLIAKYEFDINSRYVSSHLEKVVALIGTHVVNHKTVFSSNDVNFFDRIVLWSAKYYQVETMGYYHGFPPCYQPNANKLFDTMLVPSEEFGRNMRCSKFIRFARLENNSCHINFLVDSKIIICSFPDSYYTLFGDEIEGEVVEDFSSIYLFSLIESLSLTQINLRIHPSEFEFFYLRKIKDVKINFTRELNKETIIIGPLSTLFFECLSSGIPYIIFEPLRDNIRLDGSAVLREHLESPMRHYIAKNNEELQLLLQPTNYCWKREYVNEVLNYYVQL